MLVFSTLKMYCNLGNFGGLVLGPVPNLGPVLILGPGDWSGPDRLQTLIFTPKVRQKSDTHANNARGIFMHQYEYELCASAT